MKILDKYIIRKFLTTFFFTLGIILVIAVIFDISEKIDDFLKHDLSLNVIVFDYYINFLFFYGNLFTPLFIFLSVILFTSAMAYKSEIVAILSSGISFNRFMVPYFIAATFLGLISFTFNHWVVPHANKERLAFEVAYVGWTAKNPHQNLHKQIKPGHNIYVKSYNVDRNSGNKFSYQIIDGVDLKYNLIAEYIQWDSANSQWILRNYFIRTIDGQKETLQSGKRLDTIFPFLPSEFEIRNRNAAMMDTPELLKFIDDEKLRGSEQIANYMIELHQRTALPVATYILTLIGVSFASRKVRGGIGLHIATSIGISFTYILAMQVTKVYAVNAGLNPFVAVWIPNVVFGILAIYFYKRAPK